MFVLAYHCDFSPPPAQPSRNKVFVNVTCTRSSHLFVVMFAIPASVVTAAIRLILAAGETEMDPLSHEIMSVPFPEASTKIFFVVTIIDVLAVFLRGSGKPFGVLATPLVVYIIYVHLRWAPYFHGWMNKLEASAGSALWSISSRTAAWIECMAAPGCPHATHSLMLWSLARRIPE